MHIVLECRESPDAPWFALNKRVYPVGDTPTEERERSRVEAEIATFRTQWVQNHHEFSSHEFRVRKV